MAELLEEAVEQGEAIRLRWSADDEAQVSGRRWPGMRPYAHDQLETDLMSPVDDRSGDWPTGVLPKVTEDDNERL